MSGRLTFAKDFTLPLEAVTQKFAFLGRSSSGKTYGAKRLVESMLDAGAQVIVIDPVGPWSGLRAGERSFEVPVLGGLHGDMPLPAGSGAVVARTLCARASSAVLDVSQMLDTDRRRFVHGFAAEFYVLKKAAPSAVSLVLEEAQEFVPQNPENGDQLMLHELQRIAKVGRNFGIGLVLISQRPQEVNKKALNQTECVVAFQMNGPQERKALEGWLSGQGIEAQSLGALLPTLEVGRPFLWSPQWLKRSEVIQILPIGSMDTSKTPTVGAVASSTTIRPLDVAALRQELVETIDAAVASDPKILQQRVEQLEAQLKNKQAEAPFDAADFAHVMAGSTAARAELHHHRSTLTEVLDRWDAALKRIDEGLEQILQWGEREQKRRPHVVRQPSPPAASPQRQRTERLLREHQEKQAARAPTIHNKTVKPSSEAPSAGIPRVERLLLQVLAQYGRMPLARAAAIAGYPPTASTTKNAATRLRTAGHITGTNHDLDITTTGRALAGSVKALPKDRKQRLQHWLDRLPKVDARCLQVVGESKKPLLYTEVAELAGYDPDKSTAKNSVTRLRGLGLIQGLNSTGITLTDALR